MIPGCVFSPGLRRCDIVLILQVDELQPSRLAVERFDGCDDCASVAHGGEQSGTGNCGMRGEVAHDGHGPYSYGVVKTKFRQMRDNDLLTAYGRCSLLSVSSLYSTNGGVE